MVVHYRIHKISPLDPNLDHINQLYPITNYSWNIIFNNITPTTYDPFPTDVATEIVRALPISLPRDRCSMIAIFDSPSLMLLI